MLIRTFQYMSQNKGWYKYKIRAGNHKKAASKISWCVLTIDVPYKQYGGDAHIMFV